MAKVREKDAEAAVVRMQETVAQMEGSMMMLTADTQRRLRNASATTERLRRKLARTRADKAPCKDRKPGEP